jgi:hypothetical protein
MISLTRSAEILNVIFFDNFFVTTSKGGLGGQQKRGEGQLIFKNIFCLVGSK